MNEIGHIIKLKIFGQSHSPTLGVILSGIKSGHKIDMDYIMQNLDRRRPANSFNTPRKEADIPVFSGGIVDGVTTGDPIVITFTNQQTRNQDYDQFKDVPRPGHADYAARMKYPKMDLAGGGIFSGRMTVGIVAAGAILKQLIPMHISSKIVSLFGNEKENEWEDILTNAKAKGDTVGGVIEVQATFKEGEFLPLGEPFFDSLESIISHYMFAIPGIKGIEFGKGFAGQNLYGSEFNDCFIDSKGTTKTNNAGGINGGIANGNPIVFRCFVRPIASIFQPQQTFNFRTNTLDTLNITGRHDVTILNRTLVVLENTLAIALADMIERGKQND